MCVCLAKYKSDHDIGVSVGELDEFIQEPEAAFEGYHHPPRTGILTVCGAEHSVKYWRQ